MKRQVVVLSLLLPFAALAQAPAPAPAPAAPTAPAAPAAPATPVLSEAQKAQVARQNAEVAAAARRVVDMVDAQRSAEIWSGASVVARNAVTREAFVSQLKADRDRLGALQSRGEPSVSYVRHGKGGAVPEGLYASVTYPTRFANNVQPVRELVSFRLDEDNVWRVAGYSLRAPGATAAR